jgi:AcrR family transcriptional regulator
LYSCCVPRLWTETIEAHRNAVRETILNTAWALTAERGLRGVTMGQIAEGAGIGRATLYKYFPDLEAILSAWHERQVAAHLAQLAELRQGPGAAGEHLVAVLTGYAHIAQQRAHHGPELAALLHPAARSGQADAQVDALLTDLLADAAAAGDVRDDVAPDELARYCRHALGAAAELPSRAAVERLMTVTLAGLRPPAPAPRS